MKWHIYAGIFAISISMHPASAVGPDGRFSVKGPGGSSCGTWTESRKDPVAGANNVSWMLGYVTAYGRYGWSLSSNVAADTDNIGLVAWMDNYCVAHPLKRSKMPHMPWSSNWGNDMCGNILPIQIPNNPGHRSKKRWFAAP